MNNTTEPELPESEWRYDPKLGYVLRNPTQQSQPTYGRVAAECCPACGSTRPAVALALAAPLAHYTCRHAWHMPERLSPRAQDAVDFTAAVDRLFSGEPELPRSVLDWDPRRECTSSSEYMP